LVPSSRAALDEWLAAGLLAALVMNAVERLSDLRKALSDCIGLASDMGGAENERAVQDLIAFLWAAQDTLDRISPPQNVSLGRAAGGSVETGRE
jgi:hypothetical protein